MGRREHGAGRGEEGGKQGMELAGSGLCKGSCQGLEGCSVHIWPSWSLPTLFIDGVC